MRFCFLTSWGLALAAEYSTVLYVEDMSGLNDGTVYSIRTARDPVVFSLKKWDFCCDLLGMAVGYGCWVWQPTKIWLGMANPQTFDLRSYQPWPATTLLKFRGETELQVSEMVGELKVSLSRWRILAWDLIVYDFLFISNRFFNIHASHSPPLMCGIWAFLGVHRFLLYRWCGPPKT